MDVYYKLLEINPSADIQEIKRAYRRKAKMLHPDSNKSPDAEIRFIELNQAYQYLLALKTKGSSPSVRPKATATDDPQRRRQAAAHKKAQEAAKKRYKEQSAKEEAGEALALILTQLLVVCGILFAVFFPLLSFVYNGWSGFTLSLFVLLVVSPFLWSLFKEIRLLSLANFLRSLEVLKINTSVTGTVITFLNIWLLLWIGFQTLVPLYGLLAIYVAVPIGVFAALKMRRSKNRIGFMCCCIAPLVFNLVLTANYFISFDPVREHYKFGTQYQTVYDTHSYSSSRQPSTLIVLENNAYEEYPGIRVFNNLEAMHGKGSVEYTFRRGFLGVRVMTDYVFK